MNAVAEDVLARFLAAFPTGDDAALVADPASPPDATSIDRAPFWTVVVRGRHQGQEGPRAFILLTVPSWTADAPEVLEFAVCRARANKTPYFVTWTMREATLWRTPRPGIPAARDALERVHGYFDLFEISNRAREIAEPIRLRVIARGREIIRDLERLIKHGTVDPIPIDGNDPYLANRLLAAIKDIWPRVTDSLSSSFAVSGHSSSRPSRWVRRQNSSR
ncbi:MAG: hypothetical protein B7Z74_09025 [Deltaproteobacteria bacterium 21-66-5]|nr:MAG: hypothetical protein B7Z74_09025 [Deltaproteobacteria bacterium 21-66-5]